MKTLPKKMKSFNPHKQTGAATLTIGIIILFAATLVTFFAAKQQVQEQRISSNEHRSKMAFQTSQAGLDFAQMFLNENSNQLDTLAWTACDVANNVVPGWRDDALDNLCQNGWIWLEIDEQAEGAGLDDATLEYNAYLLTDDADGDGLPADLDDLLVTIVSEGASDIPAGGVFADGTGYSFVAVNVDTIPLLPGTPDVPVMAFGNVIGAGTWDIVTAPNAGGTGVPVSIWSANDASANGAMRSCNQHEYFANSQHNTATYLHEYDTTSVLYSFGEKTDDVVICDDCSCPSGESLSIKDGSSFTEGIDIVDSDPNFPDTFQYLFGINRANWEDIRNQALVIDDCSELDANSSGLIWYEGSGRCDVNSLGTPDNPVLFVHDSSAELKIGSSGNVFGIIYFFDNPDDGVTISSVSLNGGNLFYGAIISDVEIDKGNGTQQMIYSDDVLNTLRDQLTRFGRVSGTWKDFI